MHLRAACPVSQPGVARSRWVVEGGGGGSLRCHTFWQLHHDGGAVVQVGVKVPAELLGKVDLELLRSLPQGAVHARPDGKLEEVLENNECKQRVDTFLNYTMHCIMCWMVKYGQKCYVHVFLYCIAIKNLLA